MLLKNTTIYILSSIISSIISFIMIPVYTTKIDPYDYGIYGFIAVIMSIFNTLISSNLFIVFEKDYYDSSIENKNYIFNLVCYFFTIYLIGLLIVFFGQDIFLKFFNLDKLRNWIFLIITLSFFQVLVQLFILILRLKNLSHYYLYINVTISLINAIIGYILVFKYNLTWDGLLISNFITYGIVLLSIIFININIIDIRKQDYSKNIIRKYLKFAIEYFPVTLNWRIISYADRFFITKMSTLTSLGMYTLGSQLSKVLEIFISGFNSAWSPYFMESMHKKQYKDILQKLKAYIAFLSIISICIYFISPFIIKFFFNAKYFNAITYFNYFIFIVLVNAFHAIASNCLVFFDKAKDISIATTVGMITNLILNYILILENGALGAVQASLISYIVIVIIEVYFIKIKILDKGYINV